MLKPQHPHPGPPLKGEGAALRTRQIQDYTHPLIAPDIVPLVKNFKISG